MQSAKLFNALRTHMSVLKKKRAQIKKLRSHGKVLLEVEFDFFIKQNFLSCTDQEEKSFHTILMTSKHFLWNKRDSSHFDGIHLMPSSYQLFRMREREMKNLIKVRMWSNFSFKWEILTVCVCEEDCVERMVEILRCFNIKPWMEMKGGVELHSSVVFRYEN